MPAALVRGCPQRSPQRSPPAVHPRSRPQRSPPEDAPSGHPQWPPPAVAPANHPRGCSQRSPPAVHPRGCPQLSPPAVAPILAIEQAKAPRGVGDDKGGGGGGSPQSTVPLGEVQVAPYSRIVSALVAQPQCCLQPPGQAPHGSVRRSSRKTGQGQRKYSAAAGRRVRGRGSMGSSGRPQWHCCRSWGDDLPPVLLPVTPPKWRTPC